jgi:predicted ATP-grasp superfamily ATP-dependent carboligase
MRQLPSDFGLHSTFVEAVDIPELRELASQLLRTIHYTGLAEVEFMWDVKQSQFKLLEVNARLWAWHGLAIAAGLDLPYVAFANALGQKPSCGAVRKGAKWIELLKDVRVAALDIRAGTLSIRQYLTSLQGLTTFAVLSVFDPMPFIAELFIILRVGLKRLVSKIGLHRSAPQTANDIGSVRIQGKKKNANKSDADDGK